MCVCVCVCGHARVRTSRTESAYSTPTPSAGLGSGRARTRLVRCLPGLVASWLAALCVDGVACAGRLHAVVQESLTLRTHTHTHTLCRSTDSLLPAAGLSLVHAQQGRSVVLPPPSQLTLSCRCRSTSRPTHPNLCLLLLTHLISSNDGRNVAQQLRVYTTDRPNDKGESDAGSEPVFDLAALGLGLEQPCRATSIKVILHTTTTVILAN